MQARRGEQRVLSVAVLGTTRCWVGLRTAVSLTISRIGQQRLRSCQVGSTGCKEKASGELGLDFCDTLIASGWLVVCIYYLQLYYYLCVG